jgi:hypothetical protein
MIEQLIDRYVKLRDKKAEMKAEYDASVAKIDEAMEKVENFILGHLNTNGIDSVGAPAGTAFKQQMTSATVRDWDALLGHIRATESWNLLDHRVNKTAVLEFKDQHNDLPPGVNYREETVVRIRRAST